MSFLSIEVLQCRWSVILQGSFTGSHWIVAATWKGTLGLAHSKLEFLDTSDKLHQYWHVILFSVFSSRDSFSLALTWFECPCYLDGRNWDSRALAVVFGYLKWARDYWAVIMSFFSYVIIRLIPWYSFDRDRWQGGLSGTQGLLIGFLGYMK